MKRGANQNGVAPAKKKKGGLMSAVLSSMDTTPVAPAATGAAPPAPFFVAAAQAAVDSRTPPPYKSADFNADPGGSGFLVHKDGKWMYNPMESVYFHPEYGLFLKNDDGSYEAQAKPDRLKGVVTRFNPGKFGFIQLAGGDTSTSLFVHSKSVRGGAVLNVGDGVSFEVAEHNGKTVAADVVVEAPAQVAGKIVETGAEDEGGEDEDEDDEEDEELDIDLEKDLLEGSNIKKGLKQGPCEDRCFGKSTLPLGVFEASEVGILVGVADGHGGSGCADYVVSNLPSNILSAVREGKKKDAGMVPGLKHAFPQAFKQTDHNFLRIAGRTAVADGSGACVCLACICGPDQDGQLHILTANVGDSRCVLVKTEGVERLTRDHKPNDPEEKKRVEGVGGPGVVAEVQGIWRVLLAKKGIVQAGLAVSRAFGDLELKKPKELVTAVPEVKAYEVDFDEDEGLVLATDGLWDVLSDEDAARIVLQHASEGPTGCSKALVQAAKKRGSPDDITAQVILFKWRGHSAPEKAAEDDEEKDDAADEDDENDDDEDDDDDDDALTAEVKKTVRDAEKADEFLADEDETANREGFLRAASKSADEMVANAAKAAGMKDASAAAAEDSDDEEDGFKAALAAGSAKAVSQEDLDDIFG